MESYTTSVLSEIAHISANKLRKWDAALIISPPRILKVRGQSKERRYSRDQALAVMALAKLVDGGVSVRRIPAIAKQLPESLADYSFLVFDGKLLYSTVTESEALALVRRSRHGGHVVSVKEIVERLP